MMIESGIWKWFVLAFLATWRVTHLLAREDGPADLIVRFRAILGHGLAAGLMDCFNCLSLWVALPLAIVLGQSWPEKLILWPALSAGAIFAERLTSPHNESTPTAPYLEDAERRQKVEEDVLLR
jgi:hypothetical protein